jgi:protein SCO1/2
VICAHAQTLPPEQIARVGIEQKLGATIPLNLDFRDETGAPVRLGNYFGGKPVLLVLAYYDCPNLCTLVLNATLNSVRDLRLEAKRDFEIVVVSIRPNESSRLAAAKKHTYTARYGHPGTADGWHFLTGDAEPIRQLADAVGFRYEYDPKSNQFAHASGIVVLTPMGKVSRYFFGIEYAPAELQRALTDAGRGNTGSLAQRLLLLCFHYDPHRGRYTLAITRGMQVAGLGTVLLLGATIFQLARRPRRTA